MTELTTLEPKPKTVELPGPTDAELAQLREDVQRARARQAEYDQLHQELESLQNPMQMGESISAAMQEADKEKALFSKQRRKEMMDLIINRVGKMYTLKPVIGSMIAIGLAFIVLSIIFSYLQGQAQNFAGIGIQVAAAIAIVKSATRSLALPTFALLVGAAGMGGLSGTETFLNFNAAFFEHLLIVGVVGMGLSIVIIE